MTEEDRPKGGCRCTVPRPNADGSCEACTERIGAHARYRLERLAEARGRVERTMRDLNL